MSCSILYYRMHKNQCLVHDALFYKRAYCLPVVVNACCNVELSVAISEELLNGAPSIFFYITKTAIELMIYS